MLILKLNVKHCYRIFGNKNGNRGLQMTGVINWNLQCLNAVEVVIQTSRLVFVFVFGFFLPPMEGPCAVSEEYSGQVFINKSASQIGICSAKTATGVTARPWPLWYCSVQRALCPGHMPHTQTGSPIPSLHYSLIFLPSPASITLVCTRQTILEQDTNLIQQS